MQQPSAAYEQLEDTIIKWFIRNDYEVTFLEDEEGTIYVKQESCAALQINELIDAIMDWRKVNAEAG